MATRLDGRRSRRRDALGKIRLSWECPYGIRSAGGRCLDISETGLRVELAEPLELRTLVKLQAERYKLPSVASVRYCERKSNKYVVGLEYAGGQRWRGDEGAT